MINHTKDTDVYSTSAATRSQPFTMKATMSAGPLIALDTSMIFWGSQGIFLEREGELVHSFFFSFFYHRKDVI